jgi:two-component system nitrogen regulation response regulator GlnG
VIRGVKAETLRSVVMHTLLVVDDEPNLLYSLETSLQSDALAVITASTAKEGVQLVGQSAADAVLLDVRLPDMSGLDAFVEINRIDPHLPVILMTAFATTETAIEAMKRGAFDYLTKPVDLRQLRNVVAKAIELRQMTRAPAEYEGIEALETTGETIVGASQAMQEVYKAIGRVAATGVNVLILGESGTGKELVARAIHDHSKRARKPFLAINCAAIPETLLESELFGHERGAFTGAERRRVGKFEQASGGTVFLDEIGDMSGPTQAKVLRVLQDQRFERIGGNETIQTDARIVAATNQNLDDLTAADRFRRDLYYRLKVYTIHVPALRERPDDLPLLVDHFIRLFNPEIGRRVRSASPEAIAILRGYPWPGNVRELQGVIKNALVNATDEVLTSGCLPNHIREAAELTTHILRPTETGLGIAHLVRGMLKRGDRDIYRKVQYVVDGVVLREVLRYVKRNQVEASRLLGLSRTTLRAKLRSLPRSSDSPDAEFEQPDQ